MIEVFIWILIIISATIWQIALAYKLVYKNPTKIITKPDVPIIKVDAGNVREAVTSQTTAPIGVVDVGVDKKLKIESVDGSSIKSDEIIKGKVKTKKDQLRALRNG